MRTLVVGDIHGNLKGLEEVLDLSHYDFVHDKLILLGDYVDGWPDSALVINKLIYLINKANSSPGKGEVICIRGNHDKLTIMDIDTKEFWQSKLSKELYKNDF